MTVEELKNKVLQDVPITQAEAEWLATQPDKEALYEAAHEKLSLSRMTFSHQMIRLIFVEQLYRATTILNGGPYHHE